MVTEWQTRHRYGCGKNQCPNQEMHLYHHPKTTASWSHVSSSVQWYSHSHRRRQCHVNSQPTENINNTLMRRLWQYFKNCVRESLMVKFWTSAIWIGVKKRVQIQSLNSHTAAPSVGLTTPSYYYCLFRSFVFINLFVLWSRFQVLKSVVHAKLSVQPLDKLHFESTN